MFHLHLWQLCFNIACKLATGLLVDQYRHFSVGREALSSSSSFWSLAISLAGLLVVKGILHPKMKILSSFTHPQVVANLYEFLELWHH